MGKQKSCSKDTGEPSPLASLASEAAIRLNISTMFSEGKEDTSERPLYISDKRLEHHQA
jgi:hypothetical protein